MVQPLTGEDPQRLGPFELTGRLGEGGQGVVYLGQGLAGEQVAVKLLHHGLAADAEARARFLREVAVAQRVARFCTAPVLHADLVGSQPYIVSEYVPGPSLRQLVDKEGPRRGAALDRLAISTATALSAIHRAGILHRDFKPANVLMGPEGPVVIDFGIARALDSPGTTATGTAMGTPSYLSPEQLNGGEVTPAADVFAWGVTMVFAATGTPAFGQDSIAVVMNRILTVEPDLRGLEGQLRELVAASLSKDPSQRPTAEELVGHLMGSTIPSPARREVPASAAAPGPNPAQPGPSQAAPPQPGPSQPGASRSGAPQPGASRSKPKARRPVGLLLAGVAAVVALGAAAGAVVILNGDGKASAMQTTTTEPSPVQKAEEPDPTLTPDVPPSEWESPEPEKSPSPTTKIHIRVTRDPIPGTTTGPVHRPTAEPTHRPTKKAGGDSGDPTSDPDDEVGPETPVTVEPSSVSTPPAKPTTKPTAKPTTKPTATATAKPSPKPTKLNPYTATGVCGAGYQVIDSHALGNAATVYLLYSSAAGKNCVVTISKYEIPAGIKMNATLQVQGGASASNPGVFKNYAGPVRLPAAKKCIVWGGLHGGLYWYSGMSHCG
ncbi:serine/threonine protein kinase [Streptosporangium sp. NPDC000396]|uniref:serine/threonine protein kinase n=1 Tax=Streptosporangium sp. NPDC000396 TaxID=3366185 RepID=UPI0036C34FB0